MGVGAACVNISLLRAKPGRCHGNKCIHTLGTVHVYIMLIVHFIYYEFTELEEGYGTAENHI